MSTRDEEISSALPRELDQLPRLNGFRLRGLEMTRLEAFVDASFAFAVSMLVIAGQQVPDNINDLLAAFTNVPAFAASIAVLAIFWKGHWLWSRRFGLEDGVSILISWALIFTVLVYVYPLKMVFGGMFFALSGGTLGHSVSIHSIMQGRQLFVLYALGFSAIAFEILLLNLRAWYLRTSLRLDEREQMMTRAAVGGWGMPLSVGLVSMVLAMVLPEGQLAWSGWIYFSMSAFVPLHRLWLRRRLARLPLPARMQ